MTMIVFYIVGSLIVYTITMNTFFFSIFEEPLADLFKVKPGLEFRKIADPVQLWVTAVILFFMGSIEKMNKLKGKNINLT